MISNYSQHGEGQSILTERDLFIAECVSTWIAIARERYGPNWLPRTADFEKSRLFWRLRDGKEPLPHPPPTCYSCPWYEVVEELSPHWTHECFVRNGIAHIGQCGYQVESMADDHTPRVVTFGPWRFAVESAKHPQNATTDGYTIQRIADARIAAKEGE